MFWIAAVILFFIIVLSRKWVAEPFNIPFSIIGAFVVGYLALIIIGGFSCSHKFGMLGGIIGAYVGAYFGGMFDGSG